MEHIKELLQSRIEGVHDPIQRVLLQDVLVDVFGELLRYSEEQFCKLENRLDSEICDTSRLYYIYTGVCKRECLDDTSRCLFEVKTREIYDKGYLGRLFLACEYPVIRQCLLQTYKARVLTDKGEYETTVSLSYCSAYIEALEYLYRQFNLNQKQWHTINCPFLYKMLDVVDVDGKVPSDAVIQKTEIMLGELSEFVINDAVLVWNVQEKMYKTSAEVTAAGKEGIYIHKVPLSDKNAGYLTVLDEEGLFQNVFSDEGLSVRTTKEIYENIELLKIACMDREKDLTELLYPLQTNQRNMRHIDKQALNSHRCIWTKGEVERILSSYEVFKEFEFIDVFMNLKEEADIIDINSFIKEHSLLKSKRKITIILQAKDNKDIFRYEKMFFLLAELQMYTDEYEWLGILR